MTQCRIKSASIFAWPDITWTWCFVEIWLELVDCSKIAVGRLCANHDGLCIICDTYVRPAEVVKVCDEHNYGSQAGRCLICGANGFSDAYYCRECVVQEKDVS
jgi:PHD finger-like domain-containing protein 5A